MIKLENCEPMTIKIKYFADVEPLAKMSVGDWIDLRSAENVDMVAGEYKHIRLGVGMILPEGYEAHIMPRSSTFKRYGLIMACSGIIDNSYCGNHDEWLFGAYATRETHICKGDRICQFRLVQNQPEIQFETVERLRLISRGGIGSTGVR